MMIFPVRIELANVVAIRRLHKADPGEHCWPALRLRDQDQNLNGGLPFLNLLFCPRQFLDGSGSVLQRDKLATARQRDRIIERLFPARCSGRRDARSWLSYAILRSRVA
jgi:hypothetical protein